MVIITDTLSSVLAFDPVYIKEEVDKFTNDHHHHHLAGRDWVPEIRSNPKLRQLFP